MNKITLQFQVIDWRDRDSSNEDMVKEIMADLRCAIDNTVNRLEEQYDIVFDIRDR